MMNGHTIVFALALSACGHAAPKAQPRQAPDETFAAVEARALSMADHGWIVSRFADGTARDQGDSLLFTGLAMGAMTCDGGAAPEAALVAMLREKNGGVYRHPSIPNDYSLDGLLGLWWGIGHRTARCPETRELWAGLLPQHEKAVAIEPVFNVALQEVMANLGAGGHASLGDRGQLGSEVAGWAIAVVAKRQAAYRLHLGFLTLGLVDAPHGKNVFCSAVPDAKIALLEEFCGRGGLKPWVDSFAYDRFVYAHQRGAWESADGVPGLETPAIDLLVALRVLYPEG